MALVIWEVLLVNKKHCGQPNEDELIYTESGYIQELYPIRSIVSIELVNDVPSIATVFTGIAFVTPGDRCGMARRESLPGAFNIFGALYIASIVSLVSFSIQLRCTGTLVPGIGYRAVLYAENFVRRKVSTGTQSCTQYAAPLEASTAAPLLRILKQRSLGHPAGHGSSRALQKRAMERYR